MSIGATMLRRRSIMFATLAAVMACGPADLLLRGPDDTRPHAEESHRGGDRVPYPTLDGVGRDTLYQELEAGRLPGLARLLGGEAGGSSHAFLVRDAVTTFPSVTAVAWATAFTGLPPAVHGITGNEMFLRPEGRFVAPVPMSVDDLDHLIDSYSDALFAELLEAPTLYQLIDREPVGGVAWVALNHVHVGADRLLMPARAEMLEAALSSLVDAERSAFAEIDEGAVDTVLAALEEGPAPDVLTVYFGGTDSYAHVAESPAAQRGYLREIVDPKLAELAAALERAGRWYAIVVSDHGHTPVHRDEEHALGGGDDLVTGALRGAGFRPRPRGLDEDEEPFDAVLALQGGCAYLYLADRSTCDAEGRCSWAAPPRYREDVLAAAEAFRAGPLQARLAMVLVREPRPFGTVAAPFRAHLGEGRTVAVAELLAAEPGLGGPRFLERLRALAVGERGERAGDVVLVARHGEHIDQRFYFSLPHRSTHGSASAADSDIALIVAHPDRSAADLEQMVAEVVPGKPSIAAVTPLVRAALRRATEKR